MGEERIVSADGTELSARVTGSGPPLVLVHGTTGSKESWAFVEPGLAEHHTVWSYDRRGRGDSGDADDHDLGREVADVLAVLDATGEPAHLVGHSFGAVCALGAAATGCELETLVVYEPPVHPERAGEPIQRALAHLDAGEDEAALLVFLPEVAGLSEDEIAMVRSIPPVWNRFLEAAPTAGREVRAIAAQPWDPERYRGITAPTLLLSGELTDSPTYLTLAELAAAVPHAETAVLAGQRHIAFAGDPAAFVDTVVGFTRERTRRAG